MVTTIPRTARRAAGCLLLATLVPGAQFASIAAGALLPLYANPVSSEVVDTFADPAVIRAKDGHWYAYGTTDAVRQSAGDESLHYLPILRSDDLLHWTYVGDVFEPDARPGWHPADSLLWAADIRYVDGAYHLYYSLAQPPRGPGRLFTVGVATAPTPVGPWRDSGAEVIDRGTCATEADLDPALFTDLDGTRRLYWGSFEHLCTAELDAAATRVVGPVTAVHAGFAEGAFVLRRGGFHYLLVSESTCCSGAFSGYQVKVGRSRSPRGPFLDPEGIPLTAPHTKGGLVAAANGDTWVGPGHPTVATDLAGQDWLVYHAVDRADPFLRPPSGAPRRPLLVDRLDWVDGWPVLRAGRGPSDTLESAPVTASSVGSDFNDGAALDLAWRHEGAPAAHWTVAREPDAEGYVAQRAPTAGPSYLAGVVPAPAGVRAEADLRLTSTGGARGAVGLVAAYRGPGDHVAAWLDAGRGALVTEVLVAGRSTRRQVTPLPARFTFGTWHNVALEVGRGRIRVEVTEDRLHDPQALADLPLPAGAGGAGAVGVAAVGAADADNVGATSLYDPVTAAVPPPGVGPSAPAFGDEFDDGIAPGTTEDPQPWEWVRGPAGAEEDGGFRWPTSGGELGGDQGTGPVLVRPAPVGAYTLETKLTFDGDGAPFQQAGLVLYAGDDEYLKLVQVATRGGETARTEFAAEGSGPDGERGYGSNFVGPPARTMWLRLVHRLNPANGEHEVRAGTSRDGRTWVWGATWTLPARAQPRIGLISQNSAGAVATFRYVRVYRP
jgi:arabinan endo-1,5-alpha-L-arabinosidase